VSRPERKAWALWSEIRDGEGLDYSGAPVRVERLPKNAEVSPDGGWATVYRTVEGRALAAAVYVCLGPENVRRGRR